MDAIRKVVVIPMNIADNRIKDGGIIMDLSKIDDKGCHGAPDWVIEAVSPGNKPMDYYTILFKYRTAGVREYWIVDPAREMVTVYRFLRIEVLDVENNLL